MSLADLPVITPSARNLIDRVYGYYGWLSPSVAYAGPRPVFHRPHFETKNFDDGHRANVTRCGRVTNEWGENPRNHGTMLPTKWCLHFADPCTRCYPESRGQGPTCGGLR